MSYEKYLENLIHNDSRYMVLTAENRAAIRNLPQSIGSSFVDVGICEQTMIGMAAGLALRGRIPIVHALAAFLTMRAFEFIRSDVGIARLPVKLIGGVAGFLSEANGPTHQAIEDVSLMRAIPGCGIFCPADEEDMLIGLPHILSSPHPFYIRYTNTKRVVKHSHNFTIGSAEQFGEEGDVSIICYGILLKQAFIAAELLSSKGLSVSIINMRTLAPFDEEMLLIAAQRAELVITLEDHFLHGGLYSILCETLVKHGARATVLPFALNNRWFKPGLLDDVIHYEGFDAESIAQKVFSTLDSSHSKVQWQTHLV